MKQKPWFPFRRSEKDMIEKKSLGSMILTVREADPKQEDPPTWGQHRL